MNSQKLISLPPGMPARFPELERKDPEEWFCGSDPAERRVGSGGGTASIIADAFRAGPGNKSLEEWLNARKRLVIHSGGESRRLPAYAPYGKSLLPLPVFRWARGQYLDQKLIDFQASFYERILLQAPSPYCLLVGTGDVLFLSPDRFRDLPRADVLLFGIWVEDAVASRHGVFFSRKESPGDLSFVRQKPTREQLASLSADYFYLMDSGIVLFSPEAVMRLMEKAGWDRAKEDFREGKPEPYDLYGTMLTSFGTGAGDPDPSLAGLEVKLVPIHEGEFYHFGSNRDLIESTLKLQNRVVDQRLRFTREMDHHPSIFQQNARVETSFGDRHHHIWIENSHIPSSWELENHHILTGVPDNEWSLKLPEGCCLDFVPLSSGETVLRPYGFDDSFRGTPDEGVQWLGEPFMNWMEKRSLDFREAGLDSRSSILDLPIFPVIDTDQAPAMIRFMVQGTGSGSEWIRSRRLSVRQVSGEADAAALYRQREQRKATGLEKMARNHRKSIFYYLDLEKAAGDYRFLGLELPPEPGKTEPVIRRIHDSMFRARVTGHRDEAARFENKAFGILREAMTDTLRSQPVEPVRNVLDDQILWGRCPVRFDLAGGWSDTPPYCIMEGGNVVNVSVELNGQSPLQVYARPLDEPRIVLRSIDLGEKLEIDRFEQLEQYNRIGGGFSIPMAALILAGFGRAFARQSFPDLEAQLKAFGCGIEISLLAAIPKGSGLGTSSNLAATVLGTLNEFCGLNWERHEIAYRTLILEQMLTTGGGWQDQYGGIFPGIKLLETGPGIRQEPSIKYLPDPLLADREHHEKILLYYTGVTRVARDILGEIVKGMFLNSSRHLEILAEMKQLARDTFETILQSSYEGLAGQVARCWELNQRLDEGTNPPVIGDMLARVDDYLLGYKLLGAGGGGYLLMFAKSEEAALRARRILESHPPNNRARFVSFSISGSGFQVSRS